MLGLSLLRLQNYIAGIKASQMVPEWAGHGYDCPDSCRTTWALCPGPDHAHSVLTGTVRGEALCYPKIQGEGASWRHQLESCSVSCLSEVAEKRAVATQVPGTHGGPRSTISVWPWWASPEPHLHTELHPWASCPSSEGQFSLLRGLGYLF